MKEHLTEQGMIEPEPTTENYITPGLDGVVAKRRMDESEKARWVVSTPIPSVEYVEIRKDGMNEHLNLRPGLRVAYDLVTVTGDEHNSYYASNVKEFTQRKRQKPTPKNRRQH